MKPTIRSLCSTISAPNYVVFSTIVFILLFQSYIAMPTSVYAKSFNVAQYSEDGIFLRQADEHGVLLDLNLSRVEIEDVEINGEAMHQVAVPGVFVPNNAGEPNLPGMTCSVAVPRGSQIRARLLERSMVDFDDVNICPAPKIKRDSDRSPLEFFKDPLIYEGNAFYPEKEFLTSEVRRIRGVDMVIIAFNPFRWNPVTKKLHFYHHLSLKLEFIGGDGHFGEDRLRNRYFEPILRQHLINYDSLPTIDFDSRVNGTRAGECEYMIIVPDDPDFISWANVLKAWRMKEGIITEVFPLSTVGSTAVEIENYINNAYNTWSNPPIAVLLMSDYPNSGKAYGITSPMYSGSYGSFISDNVYADVDEDELPDINFARMTAQNAAHLETMVNKIINYESNPVMDTSFYNKPVSAGGWQSDRWFIICADIVFGFWDTVLNKNPTREYAGYSGTPSSWSTNSNTYMLVDYFGESGLGYIPNTPSHLSEWSANATRLQNDINAGTFMVMHRDHGGTDGWSDPAFTTSHLNGLTNSGSSLPFVFSINCLTGKFNISSECFVEEFHRMEGGALGLIGATEVSYSFVNDTYVFGMMDSMWPQFDPGNNFDPLNVGPQNMRPGFASVSGKHYLEASNWPYNPSNKRDTHALFHMHGDAFMTLYSEVPQNLLISHAAVILSGTTTFSVNAPAGTLIALSVDGILIGRAESNGGATVITFPAQLPPSQVLITATKVNYKRYTSLVDVIPPDGPYVIYDSCVIDDGSGNGNGLADYNETVSLDFTVKNVGNETASNTSVTISQTAGTAVTLSDGSEYFGNISSNSTKTLSGAFSMDLSAFCVDNEVLTFLVTVEDGSKETWQSYFSITLHAPVIEVLNVTVDDTAGNNNNRLDPAETATVNVEIKNTGSCSAHSVTAILTSPTFGMSIDQGTSPVGDITSNETKLISFVVTASESVSSGSMAAFDLICQGAGGRTDTANFQLQVGNIYALLYEPDGEPVTGDKIAAKLGSYSRSFDKLTFLPADISQYNVIFVFLGIYSHGNHQLTADEGNRLAAYLDAGGKLYMEGGDTWHYDTQTAVHPYFNINTTSDGSSDLGTVYGVVGTIFQGLSFNYTGNNGWIDRLVPLNGAFTALRNTNPEYDVMICYDNGVYKTIGASLQLGGLDGPQQDALLERLFTFFDIRFQDVPELSVSGIIVVLLVFSFFLMFYYRRTRKALNSNQPR